MPAIKPSSRVRQILEHHRIRGRSYPSPRYWEQLCQMLEEEAEKRGRSPPPAPLVHGLDHTPTEADKVERLKEQVTWADRNQLLHRIKMFFDAMPPSGWERLKK
jgi:hypothetical protein